MERKIVRLELDDIDGIRLDQVQIQACEDAVSHITMTGSVNANYESYKFTMGGDVPELVTWKGFTKYLFNQVYRLRYALRENLIAEHNGKPKALGTSMAKKTPFD